MDADISAAIATTKSLLDQAAYARLATGDAKNGHPFVSLVAIAFSDNEAPLTLISSLARHTRNLQADGRASLLFEEANADDKDLLARARVTLVGSMQQISGKTALDQFITAQPQAKVYADFKDFSLWQMQIDEAYLVAGFGKIVSIPSARLLS